jgi:hypothetical protein
VREHQTLTTKQRSRWAVAVKPKRPPATSKDKGLGQTALAPWCFYPAVIQRLTREPMEQTSSPPTNDSRARKETGLRQRLGRDSRETTHRARPGRRQYGDGDDAP